MEMDTEGAFIHGYELVEVAGLPELLTPEIQNSSMEGDPLITSVYSEAIDDNIYIKSEDINEYTNPLETLSHEEEQKPLHIRSFAHDSCDTNISNSSEETLTASEDAMSIDMKPFIMPDGTAVDTFIDVPPNSTKKLKLSLNDDMQTTIKTELVDFEVHDNEISDIPGSGDNSESAETFLRNHPELVIKFCGFTDPTLFDALLEYISDDIETITGVTKYEQLFSVLTKLHKDQGYLYLNKYVFPAAYIRIIELLYKRLDTLCKNLQDTESLPSVFLSEFDPTQKVVILDILTIDIYNHTTNLPRSVNYVRYLIGYTTFGEVFFVSGAFLDCVSDLTLVERSGVLKKLTDEYSVLIKMGSCINIIPITQFVINSSIIKNCRKITSSKLKQHVMWVIEKLPQNFKVLRSVISDFMLCTVDDMCFLDKLVFVCCMLLNMLPLCTYE